MKTYYIIMENSYGKEIVDSSEDHNAIMLWLKEYRIAFNNCSLYVTSDMRTVRHLL